MRLWVITYLLLIHLIEDLILPRRVVDHDLLALLLAALNVALLNVLVSLGLQILKVLLSSLRQLFVA